MIERPQVPWEHTPTGQAIFGWALLVVAGAVLGTLVWTVLWVILWAVLWLVSLIA